MCAEVVGQGPAGVLLDIECVEQKLDGHALTLARARFRTDADGEILNRLDLQLDFIPIVHVPNTINGAEHYGQSSLLSAAQLLDDLAAADTDSQRASATTGSPIIAQCATSLGRRLLQGLTHGGLRAGQHGPEPVDGLDWAVSTFGYDGRLLAEDGAGSRFR
ncbi:hypothetical protein [Streptomyces sp. NPDC002845]